LTGIPEEKRGRPWFRWKDNIERDIKNEDNRTN
jgi:hypothetical protein